MRLASIYAGGLANDGREALFSAISLSLSGTPNIFSIEWLLNAAEHGQWGTP